MPADLLISLRILLAAALGAAIGYQREKSGKPAGLRTHMLICMGSALFTTVPLFAFPNSADPTRIAASVVTGIGFIGAGSIILRPGEGYIVGLTTAATIWVVAAIGVAIGSGLYVVSIVATAVTLGVLFLPHLK